MCQLVKDILSPVSDNWQRSKIIFRYILHNSRVKRHTLYNYIFLLSALFTMFVCCWYCHMNSHRKRPHTLTVTSVTLCAPTKWRAPSHIVERPHRYWLREEDKTCGNNYFHNWRPIHSGTGTNQAWLKYSLKDETPWCVDAPARHSSHGSV